MLNPCSCATSAIIEPNGTYNNVATTMTNTRDGAQGTGATLDITVTGNQAIAVISHLP